MGPMLKSLHRGTKGGPDPLDPPPPPGFATGDSDPMSSMHPGILAMMHIATVLVCKNSTPIS